MRNYVCVFSCWDVRENLGKFTYLRRVINFYKKNHKNEGVYSNLIKDSFFIILLALLVEMNRHWHLIQLNQLLEIWKPVWAVGYVSTFLNLFSRILNYFYFIRLFLQSSYINYTYARIKKLSRPRFGKTLILVKNETMV